MRNRREHPVREFVLDVLAVIATPFVILAMGCALAIGLMLVIVVGLLVTFGGVNVAPPGRQFGLLGRIR